MIQFDKNWMDPERTIFYRLGGTGKLNLSSYFWRYPNSAYWRCVDDLVAKWQVSDICRKSRKFKVGWDTLRQVFFFRYCLLQSMGWKFNALNLRCWRMLVQKSRSSEPDSDVSTRSNTLVFQSGLLHLERTKFNRLLLISLSSSVCQGSRFG